MLSAQLDSVKGIVCVPENYFPFLLFFDENWRERPREELAKLFLESTDDSSILDYDEVLSCLTGNSLRRALIEIGLRIAEKTGRKREGVRAVVWKTTRLVSGYSLPESLGFRFILLQRNFLNVYQSQFRVEFGRLNRDPIRFVLFGYSYMSIFKKIDRHIVRDIEYSRVQAQLPDIVRWIGVESVLWDNGRSAIIESMGSSSWHSGLSLSFKDEDSKKIKALSTRLRYSIFFAKIFLYPSIYILSPIRKQLDRVTAEKISRRSSALG